MGEIPGAVALGLVPHHGEVGDGRGHLEGAGPEPVPVPTQPTAPRLLTHHLQQLNKQLKQAFFQIINPKLKTKMKKQVKNLILALPAEVLEVLLGVGVQVKQVLGGLQAQVQAQEQV